MADTYLLPIGETIRNAWSKVYGAKGPIWGALLLAFFIVFVFTVIDNILEDNAPYIEPVFYFITQIISFLFEMGLIYMGIKRARDEPISYQMVFHAFKGQIAIRTIILFLLQVLLLIIPLGLIIVFTVRISMQASLMAMILSGISGLVGGIIVIYLIARMSMSIPFVLDKISGPWEAIKLSFTITRGNVWRLIALYIIQNLIMIISAIPLGIGLIWTIPFALILYGTIYKNLLSKLNP